MYFLCRVVHICKQLNIPVMVDNRTLSWLWRQPAVVRLTGASTTDVSCCAFGCPWRKDTRFRSWNCSCALCGAGLRCTSQATGGICKFKQKRHQVLEGRIPEGVPWTKVAEAYSPTLVNLLSEYVESQTLSAYVLIDVFMKDAKRVGG